MVIVNVLLVLQFLNRLHFSFQPQHNCVTSTLFNPQALNVFKNIYIKKLPSLKQNILFVGKQVFFIIEMQNIECLCFSLPQHDCATSSLFSLPQNDCVTSTPPPPSPLNINTTQLRYQYPHSPLYLNMYHHPDLLNLPRVAN